MSDFLILGQMSEPFRAGILHMNSVEPMRVHAFLRNLKVEWMSKGIDCNLVLLADYDQDTRATTLKILKKAIGLAGFNVLGVMGEDASNWSRAMDVDVIQGKPKINIDYDVMNLRIKMREERALNNQERDTQLESDQKSSAHSLESDRANENNNSIVDEAEHSNLQVDDDFKVNESISKEDDQNETINKDHSAMAQEESFELESYVLVKAVTKKVDNEIISDEKEDELNETQSIQADLNNDEPVANTAVESFDAQAKEQNMQDLKSFVEKCLDKVNKKNIELARLVADNSADQEEGDKDIAITENEVVDEIENKIISQKIPEIEPNLIPEVEPTVIPEIEPEVIPEIEPEVMPEIIPQIEEPTKLPDLDEPVVSLFKGDNIRALFPHLQTNAETDMNAATIIEQDHNFLGYGVVDREQSTHFVLKNDDQPNDLVATMDKSIKMTPDVIEPQSEALEDIDENPSYKLSLASFLNKTKVIDEMHLVPMDEKKDDGAMEQESDNIALLDNDLIVDTPEDPVIKSQVLVVETVKPVRIRGRVRSGQIAFHEGDIIIEGCVHSGGEVVSNSDIHVYGPVHGRLTAGARGSKDACIYVQDFNAELVTIAGRYHVFDDTQNEWFGKSVKISLKDDALNIEAMDIIPKFKLKMA